jgi:hypothetical protein
MKYKQIYFRNNPRVYSRKILREQLQEQHRSDLDDEAIDQGEEEAADHAVIRGGAGDDEDGSDRLSGSCSVDGDDEKPHK